ncbi:MAG: hypothetical protein ACPGYY_07325, partial [Bacteroidia bacterium]
MTRRLRNFRIGDIREAVASANLRYFGLVANVPREEDVGIDVILTLTKIKKGYYLPQETVLIQIKPTGKDSIYLSRKRLKWIKKLNNPLYYLSRDNGEATIYSSSDFLRS